MGQLAQHPREALQGSQQAWGTLGSLGLPRGLWAWVASPGIFRARQAMLLLS